MQSTSLLSQTLLPFSTLGFKTGKAELFRTWRNCRQAVQGIELALATHSSSFSFSTKPSIFGNDCCHFALLSAASLALSCRQGKGHGQFSSLLKTLNISVVCLTRQGIGFSVVHFLGGTHRKQNNHIKLHCPSDKHFKAKIEETWEAKYFYSCPNDHKLPNSSTSHCMNLQRFPLIATQVKYYLYAAIQRQYLKKHLCLDLASTPLGK